MQTLHIIVTNIKIKLKKIWDGGVSSAGRVI